MTLVTTRPDLTNANGTSTLTGAATRHEALSDDSDVSYVTLGETACELEFADPVIPATAVLKTIALRARVAKVTLSGLGNPVFERSLEPPDPAVGASSVITNSVSVTFHAILAQTITEAPVDSIARLAVTDDARDDLRVYELYLDTRYVAQPTVTVSAPTGTITDDNLPTVTWERTLDTDGGDQTHFEVKVFNDAQYLAVGFDPDTSEPYAESGIEPDSAESWQTDESLENDDYRAYVRVAQTVSDTEHWSDWAFSSFTMNTPVPDAPGLSLFPEAAGARIRIEIEAANLIPNSSFEENLQGWVGTGGAGAAISRSDEWAEHGDWSLKVVAAGSAGNEGALAASNETGSLIEVEPSLTYTFGAWVRGTAGAGLRLQLQERNAADDTNISTTTEDFAITATDVPEWQEVSKAFSATGVKVRVSIKTDATAEATTFHADSVQLAAVASGEIITDNLFEIQHSLDGGVTWEPLRTLLGDGLVLNQGGATAWDLEAPNGTLVHYRVRAVHEFASGAVSKSDWTEAQAAWESGRTWLKHPTDPSLAMTLMVRSFASQQRASGAEVHKPLGRSDPIVVRDARIYESGELVVRSDEAEDRDALAALLDRGEPLLLQFPALSDESDRWITHVADHNRERVVDASWERKRWETVPWQQVARPDGALEEWPDPDLPEEEGSDLLLV